MSAPRHTCVKIDAAGALILIALSVGAYFITVAPAFKGQQTKADLARRLDEEAKAGDDLAANTVRLQRQLQFVTKKILDTSVKLLSSEQMNERLRDVGHTAGDAGLAVNVVQPHPAAAFKRFGIVSITLEGTGTYSQCTVFLNNLAGKFKDIGVRAVDLTGSPGAGGPSLSFHFELAWYIAPAAPPG